MYRMLMNCGSLRGPGQEFRGLGPRDLLQGQDGVPADFDIIRLKKFHEGVKGRLIVRPFRHAYSGRMAGEGINVSEESDLPDVFRPAVGADGSLSRALIHIPAVRAPIFVPDEIIHREIQASAGVAHPLSMLSPAIRRIVTGHR